MPDKIYEKRAVAFLDILGFKQHIEKGHEADLLDALKIPSELENDFPGGLSFQDCQISAFSDSIVISTKLHDKEGVPLGGAQLLVFLASYIQLKLIACGMLVRGGATIGDLYHKDGILLGKAMNEAYSIESELANYPRVVISCDLLARYMSELINQVLSKDLGGDSSKDEFVKKNMNSLFWRGDDGLRYINCFSLYAPRPPEFVFDGTKLHERRSPPVYGLDGGFSYAIKVGRKPLEDRPQDKRALCKYHWYSNYLEKLENESKCFL